MSTAVSALVYFKRRIWPPDQRRRPPARSGLARGRLDSILRDAETALTSVGRYDDALPDEARFTAAYGITVTVHSMTTPKCGRIVP